MTRPIVAIVPTGPADADRAGRVAPLLAALTAGGRSVLGAALTPGGGLLGGRGAVHDDAVRDMLAATGTKALSLRGPATDRAGKRLANELARRSVANAVLLCFGDAGVRTGLAARSADASLRVVAVLDREPVAPVSGADAIVCSTDPLARRMLAEHRLPFNAVTRVPPLALPLADAEAVRRHARRRLGLRDGETAYVLTGDLHEDELPDAAALLLSAVVRVRKEARLVIASRARTRAKQAVRQVGLRRVIMTAPPSRQDRSVLAAADYLLLLRAASPAARHSAPTVFGDALACGARPVMSTGIGDQSDVCAAEGIGVVISSTDATQAAAALDRDADWPGALGAEARERRRTWATEHISPARIAERLTAVLDQLAT